MDSSGDSCNSGTEGEYWQVAALEVLQIDQWTTMCMASGHHCMQRWWFKNCNVDIPGSASVAHSSITGLLKSTTIWIPLHLLLSATSCYVNA